MSIETEKTRKADRVCQLVLNKINSMLPELASLGNNDLEPFIQDLQRHIPMEQQEESRPWLTQIVLLGLFQEMAGVALSAQLEKIRAYLPDDVQLN